MDFFFNDREKCKELEKEIKSWEGTPYKHRTMRKGIGCDCINFALAVFEPFGILPVKNKDLPEYSRDRHIHSTKSLLVEHLGKHKNFTDVYKKDNIEFMDGDILLFCIGKSIGHVGIYCNNLIYEATYKCVLGLVFGSSPWHKRLKKVLRATK